MATINLNINQFPELKNYKNDDEICVTVYGRIKDIGNGLAIVDIESAEIDSEDIGEKANEDIKNHKHKQMGPLMGMATKPDDMVEMDEEY